MITVKVKQKVMKVVYEDRELSFPSLADPPVKCCRCYPNSITLSGFCTCCEFNHQTGERVEDCDPRDLN